MKNNFKILYSALLPLTLLISGCGDDNGTATGSSGGSSSSGNTGLSLSYQNARNSNALIEFAANSSFPSGAIYNSTKSTAGYFYQAMSSCVGQSIAYTFTLKNNGTGALTSTSTPAVTFTDNTNYDAIYGTASDYSYTLSTPPTFPLAAGQSTNFTMTFHGQNANCNFGEWDFNRGDSATSQKIEMVVHTNDSTNPNYSVEMIILGNS